MVQDVTSADIKYHLNSLKDDLILEETEDNWERIAKAISCFAGTCEQSGYEVAPAEVINALRNFSRPIVNAMNSERTRLCCVAIDLLVSTATGLGGDFEPLLTLFMPPLLALCGRTNKVVINRARTCVVTIIQSTQLASVLPYFLQNVKDKSASLRLIVAEGTLACLNSCNPPDLEKELRARDIENIIRSTARDANADVRRVSRKLFECYKILLPGRVDRLINLPIFFSSIYVDTMFSFTAPLTPTMKKYLDVKSNDISSQQSTSNIRANFKSKLNTKPSTSTSASTSTTARNLGHTRTASASAVSTTSQIRKLTTSLNHVVRKEPITTAPMPYAPVRSVPASRTTSESQTEGVKKLTAARSDSVQEVKGPVPPLRSQASVISRATTSTVPHRPPPTGINPTPATSGPQSSASSGPRRVPMPPPSAPAKEKPVAKRPTSRADTASSSGQRPATSAVPTKKAVVTIASSLRDRGSTTAKISVQSKVNKIPTVDSSSRSTKPLVVNNKPLWGQSAAVPRAAATASQRAVPPSKTSTKKPSSRQFSAPTSEASKTRSITPALIALPPSPSPESDGAANGAPVVNDTGISKVEEEEKDDIDKEEIPAVQEPEKGLDQNDDESSSDKTLVRQSPIPSINEVKADGEPQEMQGQESRASSETLANPTLENDHSEHESHPESSAVSTDECPTTPQVLADSADTNATNLAAKTPISALLSSIQRGFLYSPSSPLSPADSYLLPGPHGMKDHNTQIRPFNFALHPPSNQTFGKSMEEMVLGDIGVVNVTDHKLLMGSVLPDDGPLCKY